MSVSARARVVRVREDDWARYRQLRLSMLADTPIAFTETLQASQAIDEGEWRRRARRGSAGPGAATFAAVDVDGQWVGTMGGVLERVGHALLVSVFVAPSHRGGDVADLLLGVVLRWAREEAGAHRIRLLVHEANPRATAFYARHGFTRTGRTEAYPLDPSALEIEMARPLPAPGPGDVADGSRGDVRVATSESAQGWWAIPTEDADSVRSQPAHGRAGETQERPR